MSKQAISTGRVEKLKLKYAENKQIILSEPFKQTDTLPTFETFDRAVFEKILAQEECVAVRMYYGMDDDLLVKLIAVGVDINGMEIKKIGENLEKAEWDDPLIAFTAIERCPPFCDPPPPPPDEP